MKKALVALAGSVLLAAGICAQVKSQKPPEDRTIRIGTQLVQLDAVVVDKNGKIVTGLTKDDFELYDGGKKQVISFFEFVESGKAVKPVRPGEPAVAAAPAAEAAPQGLGTNEVKRIFAFV